MLIARWQEMRGRLPAAALAPVLDRLLGLLAAHHAVRDRSRPRQIAVLSEHQHYCLRSPREPLGGRAGCGSAAAT